MNIETELNHYISLLTPNEKHLLLQLIKKIRSEEKNLSFAEAVIRYNDELEAAVKQIKEGNYIPHEDVLKESSEW
ncbi:MAG: hypothetical protein ACTHJ5_08385 [Ilyomonas sp.]